MSDVENFKNARTRLRHAAHVYANTPKDDPAKRESAIEDLENAAITMALFAAIYGVRTEMKPVA